jgi:hypothetical protein
MGATEMPMAEAAQHKRHFNSILCFAVVTVFRSSRLWHGHSPQMIGCTEGGDGEDEQPSALFLQPDPLMFVVAGRKAFLLRSWWPSAPYPTSIGTQREHQCIKEVR